MKGQAMIIDALFFLMLCGMSAAILAWASSVYGNQALDAYKYLYLIDLETSALQTVTESSYVYANNELYWIDQLGRYLDGQFNESDPRFKYLLNEWGWVCNVSGTPLVMYVYPEVYSVGKTSVCAKDNNGNKVCASVDHPLVFTCKFIYEKNHKEHVNSTLESVLEYMCGTSGTGTSGIDGYVDLGARASKQYAHLLFLDTNDGFIPDSCTKPKTEPPYYASSKFAKLCHDRICDMYAKVYY